MKVFIVSFDQFNAKLNAEFAEYKYFLNLLNGPITDTKWLYVIYVTHVCYI